MQSTRVIIFASVHSGHRRWAALRFMSRTHARAVVHRDLQESDAGKVALSDNLGRADLSAYEQANALRGYCEATGLSVEQAAAELGLNRRTAFRLQKVVQAPEPVQLVIREHRLSARSAELLAKLGAKQPKRAVRLGDKFAAGKLSLEGLEAEVRGRSKRAPAGSKGPTDVVFKADDNGVSIKLELFRAERTDEQIERAVAALSQVLVHLGIDAVSAATGTERAGEGGETLHG